MIVRKENADNESAQEHPDQYILQTVVRHIAERKIQPGALFHDALFMGEGIETLLAVIAAHAAVAHAAKAHAAGGEVDDGIIDAAAAERHSAEETLLSSSMAMGTAKIAGLRRRIVQPVIQTTGMEATENAVSSSMDMGGSPPQKTTPQRYALSKRTVIQ